ncbi:hypothetical protein CKAN_02090800 [Cinnamomum micranthum f. kanehirae]|uniref:Uncharacterized protein n=1 Tax=Cinnamomum micranthum f. kanehirae TaxID=337451 RepID=A0A3S4PKQ3_9MAGN|nr:hypothetical protein CKAN_02090800 [Cinnamomum micranthum f. kanehirae]
MMNVGLKVNATSAAMSMPNHIVNLMAGPNPPTKMKSESIFRSCKTQTNKSGTFSLAPSFFLTEQQGTL